MLSRAYAETLHQIARRERADLKTLIRERRYGGTDKNLTLHGGSS